MEVEDWDDVILAPPKEVKAVKMDIPQTRTETFYCQPMHCTLQAHHCPTRQLATMKAGKKRVPDPRFSPCVGGKCVQGRRIMKTDWAKEYARASSMARDVEVKTPVKG